MFWLLLIGLLLLSVRAFADDKPDAVTRYQYPVNNHVWRPASLFNPIISEKRNGEVHKSFFQHQPSKLFPAGSTFNPLISTQEKKGR
jgi:hypothetical protein